MSDIAIKIENLSKQYRLGLVGTGTLSHDLNRWWHGIRGKEDPYLKIGEANEQENRGNSEYVWALKDIDFEVKKGEILGIIGKNGAGKSTLLKILSKVTGPTTGSVRAKGRIGALLEVGTGFHPELTGRENIYLNGTILGMTRQEVSKKLDEIVDFAGVARYLETPVKRYSSGMMVRLGFAVAAHLEPEILVVDEVLAVGDAEFQKKAVGKMKDVSEGEGRTVLFVSHNMGSVKNLCNKGMLLQNGKITFCGTASCVVDRYLMNTTNTSLPIFIDKVKVAKLKTDGFKIKAIKVKNLTRNYSSFFAGDCLKFSFFYENTNDFVSPAIVISCRNEYDIEMFRLSNLPISGFSLNKLKGKGVIECTLDSLPFSSGFYSFNIGFVREKVEWYFNEEKVITIFINSTDVYESGFNLDSSRGLIWIKHHWNHEARKNYYIEP